MSMEPVPETQRADDLYGPFALDGEDLLEHLERVSGRVRQLVPDCVGLSFSSVEEGVTFALVATDCDTGLLDGIQYAAGGPCAQALVDDEVVAHHDAEDLGRSWPVFASAAAASAIRSTLSLPVVTEGRRTAGYNLYATSDGAFHGSVEQLAELLGAEHRDAAHDADLAFSSRQAARDAPQALQDSTQLTAAAGLLGHRLGVPTEEAEARLRRAAVRSSSQLEALVERTIQALETG